MTLTDTNFPTEESHLSWTVHTVATGETLESIAGTYGVDAAVLYELNAHVLDRQAKARGLQHSEGGRILFPGVVLKLKK